MAVKRDTTEKKKKKWVQILAPKEFKNIEIGETYVENPENSVGKTIQTNLMSITRDPKKQSNNIKFRITEFKNNVLNTEVMNISMQTAQLKRTTRKDKIKIEDSFVVNTKDNKKVRIKPILLTKTLTSNSKLTAIRKSTREIVSKIAEQTSFHQFLNDIISGQLLKAIKNDNRKIYPLASCTIKKVERLN